MAQIDPPFAVLDEAAIRGAVRHREPYDFAFVDRAMRDSLKAQVLADLPEIPWRGSYAMGKLRYGPSFEVVLNDLLSGRFRRLVERTLEMDLSRYPASIVMTGDATGAEDEGRSHPDSRHKKATVVVGFSDAWPHRRGRFRVLRSDDREDCAFEFPPVFGKMLMFRVSDHSWHGALPQKGACTTLQLSYVDTEWYAWREEWRHGISAAAKANPITRRILEWAPRRLF